MDGGLQVDRAALPAPDWSLKVARPYLPPQNRLEVEVQLIWQAVMNKKDRISCDADFSDIGGNMMHAVIANGMNLVGLESKRQQIVLGLVILSAVVLDRSKAARE